MSIFGRLQMHKSSGGSFVEKDDERTTDKFLLKDKPTGRYRKFPMLKRLILLCEDIQGIYKKKILPSQIFNYIYFSACLFVTFKKDIEQFYKLNMSTTSSEQTLFRRGFLASRAKEEDEYGGKLCDLFIESISILQETYKYQNKLQSDIPPTKKHRRKKRSYKDLREAARMLRSEITNKVFSWRRLIDVKLSEFGQRTTRFNPKDYIEPLDVERVDFGVFAESISHSNGEMNAHKLDILDDFRESGEDNSGGISYYLHEKMKENPENVIRYNNETERRIASPKLRSIGPFDVIPLDNDMFSLFKLTVGTKAQVGELCHLSLNFNGTEIALSSSELSGVTFSEQKRKDYDLPVEETLYYCFVYPFSSSVHNDRHSLSLLSFYGGFVYFDEQLDKVIAASALLDRQQRILPDNTEARMSFSFPVILDPTRYDPSLIMFHRCNFHLDQPVERFAWVNAGELGFDNAGCFVFEDSNGSITYFNLIGNEQGSYVYEVIENNNIDAHWKNFIPLDVSLKDFDRLEQ